MITARGAADSRIITNDVHVTATSIDRFAGSTSFLCWRSWGFAALHPRLNANVRSAD
jgi:hypothetical protein